MLSIDAIEKWIQINHNSRRYKNLIEWDNKRGQEMILRRNWLTRKTHKERKIDVEIV